MKVSLKEKGNKNKEILEKVTEFGDWLKELRGRKCIEVQIRKLKENKKRKGNLSRIQEEYNNKNEVDFQDLENITIQQIIYKWSRISKLKMKNVHASCRDLGEVIKKRTNRCFENKAGEGRKKDENFGLKSGVNPLKQEI